MKAVIKEKQGTGATLVDIDKPVCGPYDALIKVMATSICGSDLHIYEWNEWAAGHVKPPQTMGHEFAGEVIEVGKSVNSVKVGDYVSAETHIWCGNCSMCKSGNMHICKHLKILGVDTNGCFADYVVVPAKVLWINEKSMPPKLASIQEPMGNAFDTVNAEPVSNKSVLITGAGPIGLMAAAISKHFGCSKLIVSDLNATRLDIAKRLGADAVVNPQKESLQERVFELTKGEGVDVLLEMSGNENALKDGLKSLKLMGRVSMLGLFNRDVLLNLNEYIVMRMIRIYGITGRRIFSTWQNVQILLTKIDFKPIITHEFDLKDYEKGMELMIKQNCGKVVLYP